jgi:hypothetical protein
MPETRQPPTTPASDDWTASQVKQYVDEKFYEIQRAVDVAREGQPPHVTLQHHLEVVLQEREKALQLALTSADKLEQERIARTADQISAESRIAELTRQLSDTAILKAESAADKRFEEFAKTVEEQIRELRTSISEVRSAVQGLAGA